MNCSEPRGGDALVIVDVQNDFLPGGTLAVPNGDEVIPVLNDIIAAFQQKRLPIFATRDWHPPNHCSFTEFGGAWPRHCVVESHGAAFPLSLHLPISAVVISKPSAADCETYSGFQGTDLLKYLQAAEVKRIFVGGLATDYCVLNTVKDALRFGFHVLLIEDAIRAVDAHAGDGARAKQEMIRLGAIPVARGKVLV